MAGGPVGRKEAMTLAQVPAGLTPGNVCSEGRS